jgi:diguanylate cyclase
MSLPAGERAGFEPAAEVAGGDESVPDGALDAFAAILRELGRTAGAGTPAAEELETWAHHVLVLGMAPGSRDPAPVERDWPGLSRHVVAYLRENSEAVADSIGELRDAVWLVIERLSRAVVTDAASDATAAGELERLRAAIDRPAEELKATALETVQRLSEILDEKHTRQVQLARELGERINVLNDELADTRREADVDPLTQVWNRGVFQRELPRAMQIRTLLGEPVCLVLIDIDEFKQINDTHGHRTGDAVLEAIGRALVRCFPRRSDVVTRLGGDEFAVIAPSTTAVDGYRLATRVLDAVREIEGTEDAAAARFTVSAGLAEALSGEDAESWFARADRALYAAKAEGRDRLVIGAETQMSEL